MTTFQHQLDADLAAVFYNTAEFADASVYTPVAGDVVDPCPVMVEHDALIQADGYDARIATLGTTVTAQVSDVGTLNRGDTFLVGDTTYTVQRIERYSQDGREITAVVK